MPDIGDRDLQDANAQYNARLVAAGVPAEGTAQVIGALLNGDLFDGADGADVAAMLGENYAAELQQTVAHMAAVTSVHSMALGVIAERKRWEPVMRRVQAVYAVLAFHEGHDVDGATLAQQVRGALDGES